ncbi:hypothetical protein B7P43_G10223 [Cryptotermes secundus]|uniref:MYND-type domain-containing protein n=1 Tax=Cryptotermes secundus TaxID=105785 RepID=A0A2J7QYY5_9NEOP|nr:uncharacterized protein LOC111864451 [Cryptotermes secundus]PNF33793.1 hypothetical protein B7P43_G10223 [Cryptotermes secundus]
MALLYDTYFYGTVCHVCKCKDDCKGEKLKRCGGCRMVLYCGPQHQKVHWPLHKRLCKCIQAVVNSRGLENLYQEACKNPSTEDWCKLRSNLMLLTQLSLGRRLSEGEQQMFMFPRICKVCYKAEQVELQDCNDCLCVSYCSVAHKQQDSLRHSISCRWLKLCLCIDRHFLQVKDPYPFLNVPVREKYEPLPCDIDSFISITVTCAKDTTEWNRSIEVALFSELLTCPLTLLYALEKLRTSFKKKFMAHVVGAGAFECTFLHKWEIILHCLPQLSFLDIVFIGPEIEQGLETICVLCVDCQRKGRQLRTHFQTGKLYHQYASSETFLFPDIIVAYNCGLHEYEGTNSDTWLQSLPFLVKFDHVPLILTSYTSDEANKDVARILGCKKDTLTVYLKCSKNPFASRRPYRDWRSESSDVFFQNNFITLVTPY